LNVCEDRDVKGLYKKARSGEIAHFTGVSDPYEAPETPEIECRTDLESEEESVNKVIDSLKKLGYLEDE
jgi:adenylylsulfate kinase